MNTRYLNTNLDLEAAFDLNPLTAVLEAKEIYPLHVTQKEDGCWVATLERVTFANNPSDLAETTISNMLNVIEALQGETLDLWSGCSIREFNIGYECGDTPFCFHHGLTNGTLLRVARAGAGLRITLYGTAPQRACDEMRRLTSAAWTRMNAGSRSIHIRESICLHPGIVVEFAQIVAPRIRQHDHDRFPRVLRPHPVADRRHRRTTRSAAQ